MLKIINKIAAPLINRLPENNRLERIWILAKTDFKKRYYETGLGLLWALINPLMKLAVYTVAFIFIRASTIDHFSLYLFSGLLIWMFFTELTSKGINALNSKKYLMTSIQFNWLDIFIAASISSFFGFLFNFLAYFLMSILTSIFSDFDGLTSIHVLWFPLLAINITIIAASFAILLGAINIFLKDITHLWSIVILAGFWSAPIFFPVEPIREKFAALLYIHPATSVIINMRNVLFYNTAPEMEFILWGWIYAFTLLPFSIYCFKKAMPYAIERM